MHPARSLRPSHHSSSLGGQLRAIGHGISDAHMLIAHCECVAHVHPQYMFSAPCGGSRPASRRTEIGSTRGPRGFPHSGMATVWVGPAWRAAEGYCLPHSLPSPARGKRGRTLICCGGISHPRHAARGSSGPAVGLDRLDQRFEHVAAFAGGALQVAQTVAARPRGSWPGHPYPTLSRRRERSRTFTYCGGTPRPRHTAHG